MFDARSFQQSLATEHIGRFIVYRPTTETTMVLARREADEGAPHGTLVLAEEQTAGRGRRGRSFYSPPGENLYFTLVLRLPPERARCLPVAVPVAVALACREAGVDARIKWPNDVWVGDRKLAGMLIDAEGAGGGTVVMPGIGINVNGDPTLNPELREIATSLKRELARPVHRESLLASICNGLEAASAAPALALETYRSLSMVLGREVRLSGPEGEREALALDLADDGGLVIECAGVRSTVYAADVTLRPR
ncbi:MAG: biotin--[acetyl-CoA-carboxylase] ligase [Dehalococcoidia bacterium]